MQKLKLGCYEIRSTTSQHQQQVVFTNHDSRSPGKSKEVLEVQQEVHWKSNIWQFIKLNNFTSDSDSVSSVSSPVSRKYS